MPERSFGLNASAVVVLFFLQNTRLGSVFSFLPCQRGFQTLPNALRLTKSLSTNFTFARTSARSASWRVVELFTVPFDKLPRPDESHSSTASSSKPKWLQILADSATARCSFVETGVLHGVMGFRNNAQDNNTKGTHTHKQENIQQTNSQTASQINDCTVPRWNVRIQRTTKRRTQRPLRTSVNPSLIVRALARFRRTPVRQL